MIRILVDDVACVRADAVVRGVTCRLEAVDRAGRRLDELGGPSFTETLRTPGLLDVGAAVVTATVGLQAELAIHAVVTSDTEPVTAASVRRALRSALQRAEQWELSHIAIPLLGSGPGQLPVEDAARLLFEELRGHEAGARYPTEVSVVVDSDEVRAVLEDLLARARSLS